MVEIPDLLVESFLKEANHYFQGLEIKQETRGIGLRAFEATLTCEWADKDYWTPTSSFRAKIKHLVKNTIGLMVPVDVEFNNTGTSFWIVKK